MSSLAILARWRAGRRADPNRVFDGVLSTNRMADRLRREQALSDRLGEPVALLIFGAGDLDVDPQPARRLVAFLRRRLRGGDAIGRLEGGRIGVLLPATTFHGACVLAVDVQSALAEMAHRLHVQVHCYPELEAACAPPAAAGEPVKPAADGGGGNGHGHGHGNNGNGRNGHSAPPAVASKKPAAARRRSWTRWPARIACMLAGTLAAALALEGLVLAIHGPTVRFARHVVEAPWGLRYNQPNARYRHRSADVNVGFRINAQGMRADEDVGYAKPAGARRIVCLGDSFTIGYEVEESQTFARVLERDLRARGRDVEVLNCGVSGFSTAEELLYLERELWRYEPDVVLLSFYVNDLEDNVRTGLFALRDGELVATAERYVPLGRLGNLLNTNPLMSFLSERSNAAALLKERITLALKARMVEARTEPAGSTASTCDGGGGDDYERALAAALLERLHAWCRDHGIELVIQSIPAKDWESGGLTDAFPYELFEVEREGLRFVRTQELLTPLLGVSLLYWTRSHGHWTPLAHEVSGEELARLVLAQGLLD